MAIDGRLGNGGLMAFDECFEPLYNDADAAMVLAINTNDALFDSLEQIIVYNTETPCADLYEIMHHIWDTAYNHGYHDAQADEGLTLAEMTD